MSLRTDFTGSIDTKLAEARTAGLTLVGTTSLATITTEMAAAAAKGLKSFTVMLVVSYQPQDIRIGGCLWEAFKSGCEQALSSEDVMDNEVDVILNRSDTVTTQIDLNFTF